MRSRLFSISLPFLFFPLLNVEKNELDLTKKEEKAHVVYSPSKHNETEIYNELQLSALGLSKQAFQYAYKGYQHLIKKKRLVNSAILTICDLSQSSNKKRFYILNLNENKVLMTTYVAHGRSSGGEYASRFSNNIRSHQSSLGFYITSTTYNGQNGFSLKLKGLEAGFNDRAGKRNIVLHGAAYIGDEYLQTNKFMGRSYGCPAVPINECNEVIDLIKNGTCLFIYYPTKKYLQRSKILND
ncbi:MAG TPA: murein L,D-transpeptidase catalytic domain family protein [Chitinophagaceae bacterium]|nr:murein L,D-transpeptidase catalytic domain family protein [Chitinophagaceae bacterium]